MRMRFAVRGFAGRNVVFVERYEIDESQVEALLPNIATRHAERLASQDLHMIEIEFLDEPDEHQRFFRFGSDPRGMVVPIPIDLPPEGA